MQNSRRGYMILRQADAATEAGARPTPAALADMDEFNRQLEAGGALGLALGLRPTRRAVRLKMWPGGESITDGPFTESKELVAGFTIFQAESRAAAIEQLKRWPVSDGDVTLELRETGCPGGCASVPPGEAGDEARYVILLRSDAGTERDDIPAQHLLDTLNTFNAVQAAEGRLLAGDGLMSTARGARVKLASGRASVIDGPFTEAKELVAGFWMVRARSMLDAIEFARSIPYPTGPRVEVEIREVMTAADLMPALSAEQERADFGLRAEQLDAALRAHLAARPSLMQG
ncbi:hypothetical protein E4L96_08635 [Massilia arenosa]|uniref:YCII-related domain-containing protein n=1 Tax=Zemynaea arenosa TaxID=2561931 RepID=A0A4Y9SFD3_9BURK|nr:YciI family protein [Massilia arenosa]TFW21663.1 hypothetical protein E4L96_08635 [Massilia arenosa]